MTETVLERHYRDRVQSVRQLAARKEGQAAPGRQELEDLVALCIDLSASGRDLLEKEYRRLFKEPKLTVAWLRERRQVMEELTAGFLHLAESVRACVREAGEAAATLPARQVVSRLDDAINTLGQARQSVLERWPVGTDDQIAEARASAARGEGLDVDEAFAQIAGVPVEAWRLRVEEYKRQCQA